jgi:hypothetical protein
LIKKKKEISSIHSTGEQPIINYRSVLLSFPRSYQSFCLNSILRREISWRLETYD